MAIFDSSDVNNRNIFTSEVKNMDSFIKNSAISSIFELIEIKNEYNESEIQYVIGAEGRIDILFKLKNHIFIVEDQVEDADNIHYQKISRYIKYFSEYGWIVDGYAWIAPRYSFEKKVNIGERPNGDKVKDTYKNIISKISKNINVPIFCIGYKIEKNSATNNHHVTFYNEFDNKKRTEAICFETGIRKNDDSIISIDNINSYPSLIGKAFTTKLLWNKYLEDKDNISDNMNILFIDSNEKIYYKPLNNKSLIISWTGNNEDYYIKDYKEDDNINMVEQDYILANPPYDGYTHRIYAY